MLTIRSTQQLSLSFVGLKVHQRRELASLNMLAIQWFISFREEPSVALVIANAS